MLSTIGSSDLMGSVTGPMAYWTAATRLVFVRRADRHELLFYMLTNFPLSLLLTVGCWAYWCPCVVFSKTRQRLRSLQYQGRPLEGGGERFSNHCCIYSALLFIGHPWIMQVRGDVDEVIIPTHRGLPLRFNLASKCGSAMPFVVT
jgi:hypothetical protein